MLLKNLQKVSKQNQKPHHIISEKICKIEINIVDKKFNSTYSCTIKFT